MVLFLQRTYDAAFGDRVEIFSTDQDEQRLVMRVHPASAVELGEGLINVATMKQSRVVVDARPWKVIRFMFAASLGMGFMLIQEPTFAPFSWIVLAVALAGCAWTWNR